MVIDAAKGVEPQTRKLFKVCAMRGIPIFTFMNKLDRDARDSFELLDDIENELGIPTCPMNWPIGSGKDFKGIYDRGRRVVIVYSQTLKGTKEGVTEEIALSDKDRLAGSGFAQEEVDAGRLSPVFFGSALTNFGVEIFLQNFLKMTSGPLARVSDTGVIEPVSDVFSAFVFKIQANMNKTHRDRIAFMRICSGKFSAQMEVMHVQGGKVMRLSQPQQMMASQRHVVDEAYAGDIIPLRRSILQECARWIR